jgi:hypothetical protein
MILEIDVLYKFNINPFRMKKIHFLPLLLMVLTLSTLSSCQLIGDIFKAGVWAGVLLVVGIVALGIFLLAKIFGGK